MNGALSDAANPSAPIGVFDSGLGGLTVMTRLQQVLPLERFLYIADQAHVPYGGRDLAEVRSFASSISSTLLAQGCKALVMACNISTATALASVQEEHPSTPVIGVIAPGAFAAAARTSNGRIGILATEGTVRSGAYTQTLTAINASLVVIESPCPAFVPLIEAEHFNEAAALSAARDYLVPLIKASVDTVILGCTHYPFLLPALRSASCNAPFVQNFVDPAEYVALELAKILKDSNLLSLQSDKLPHYLVTTGDVTVFAKQCARFLTSDFATARIAAATWSNGQLMLPGSVR